MSQRSIVSAILGLAGEALSLFTFRRFDGEGCDDSWDDGCNEGEAGEDCVGSGVMTRFFGFFGDSCDALFICLANIAWMPSCR